MDEKILDFINRRFSNCGCNWMNGNCYWFAVILTTRFPRLKIYYDPVEGHFISRDMIKPDWYYDFDGAHKLTKEMEKRIYHFATLGNIDPIWAARLKEQCVD